MPSGKSTGSMVGTIAGAVVGALLAYPTGGMSIWAGLSLGATVGGLAGGVAGAAYDRTNPVETYQEQESIADIVVQTSTYGQAWPQVIGRGRLAANVIDISQKQEVEHRDSVEPSGKGGGTRQVTVTKTYTVSLDLGLCDTRIFGEIAGIGRVWADNTLIYDATQSGELPEGWTFYAGTAPQDPDPTFEALHGAGEVPGYPYLCHLVIEDYDMGAFPRVPNFTFELLQSDAGDTALTQLVVAPTDGHIWVAVPGMNQVWRYDPTTRERLAVVTLSADAPAATGYGFGLLWGSDDHLWVGDPVGYALRRIDPATNTVVTSASTPNSLIGNLVESGGYVWAGTLQYDEVVANDNYAGAILAFTSTGMAGLTYTQDFSAVRSWLRLAVTSYDGHIWSFSDEDDGNTSEALAFNQTTGNQAGNVGIAVDARIMDVLNTPADGHLWLCDWTNGTVTRVTDPSSYTTSDTITVGAHPVQAGVASDGFVWVASTDGVVTRIDPSDNSTQTFHSDTPNVISPNNTIWAQGPSGAMWLCCTDSWTVQRFTTTGTSLTVATGTSPRSIAPGADDSIWVVCGSGDLQQIQDDGTISVPTSVSASRLQDVVSRACEAAGLTSDAYDVSGLSNQQVILTLVNIAAVRAPLEQLSLAHNFQMIESNEKLIFKLRGREPIRAVIPEGDLDAREPGTEDTPGLSITRLQDAELPTMLSFSYTAPTRNYQQGTQQAFVSTSQAPTENGRAMTTAVGLSDQEAKQRAQEMLDRLWVERNSFSATVGRKYAYLEPMDRIQVVSRGVTHTITLNQATYGRPGVLELAGVSDSAATQYVLGALPGGGDGLPGPVGTMGQTVARLLNLPALSNNDQTARFHVVYEYAKSGWPGATLHRSLDGGASYQYLHTGHLVGITGTVASALPAADWHILDTVNTITVVLKHGTLTSVADSLIYNGAVNVVSLGNELLQFATATLVGPRTYELSRLLRARRGTEWAVDTHTSNELFVLLDAAVYRIPQNLLERHYPLEYKAVTNGLLISTVTPVTFTCTDANLIPMEIFPEATLDAGTGDWTITWVLRSRFFGDWVDFEGVGFDQDFQHFRVEIFDAGFSTVVRAVQVDPGIDPEVTYTLVYTAAQQTTDFGVPITTLRLKAYQVASGGTSFARATTFP